MARRTTILGSLSALVVAGLTLLPSGAASAATLLTESQSLPIGTYGEHLVDGDDGRIFVTPGPGGERVAVTDLRGRPVTSVGGLPGARHAALSGDGLSLFLSLETGDVVEVDPDTLEVRDRITVPAASLPVRDLAWSAGRLWVLTTRATSQADLSTLDPDTGTLVPTGVPVGGRSLAATPSSVVVMKDQGGSTLLSVGPDGVLAERTLDFWFDDVGASASGQTFVHRYSPEDQLVQVDPTTLQTVRTVNLPGSLATTDGTLAAAAADSWKHHEVVVKDATTSLPLNVFRVPYDHPTDSPAIADVLLGPEGLVVFAAGPDGVTTWFQPSPGTPGTRVRLQVPDPSWIGETTVVTGVVEDDGRPIPGAELTITDRIWFDDSLPPRTRTVTADAEGRFSFDHIPRAWGETFLVEYAGDAEHPPALEEVGVTFEHQPTTLEVDRPAGVAPGEPVVFRGRLSALADDPVPDAPVLVEQTCSGTERPFEVRTDELGEFVVEVVPGRCLDPIFRFSFGSDSWTYEPVSVTRTVPVSWSRSTVSLVQPAPDQRVGSTFSWSGTLLVDSTPAIGAELTYQIRRYASGTAVAGGTVETDQAGGFTIQETIEHADRYQLNVSYAGDATTLAGSGYDEFVVTRIPTSTHVDDADLESVPDEPVELTGVVVAPDGSPVTDHEVHLDLGGIVRDTVLTDATGRFTFTTVPPPPSGWADDGRRVYGIVATQTSRHAESRAVARVVVAPAATRLVLDEVPSPSSPGDAVTLSGRLTTATGTALPGRTVSVVHTDGVQDTYTVTTDDDGRFGVETTIRTGLAQHLHAAFAGTPAYGASSAEQHWAGRPLPGTLVLEPVPVRLLGETVRISGRLTAASGDGGTADITVTRLDGYGAVDTTYPPVATAADGSFALEVPADHVGGITYVASSSVWDVAAQTASLAVEVRRLVLRTTALDPDASRKGWAVYDARRDPRLSASATPARAGLCISQEVQRLRRDRWRPVLSTGCTDTGAGGVATTVLDVRHPVGSRWRVRPYRESSVATRGAWVKLRFR
jgi:protocatechuate 3,4-dioxygenase beta subunit